MRRKVAWVLCLALWGVPHIASARTLTQLISDSRILVLDGSSATRQRFNDSVYTNLLNNGQRDSLTQSRCIRQSMSFTLVPGTTYYPLPTNYLTMERLTIGSKYIQEMSPAALDGRSRGWESASGYPTYYFINWSSPTMVGFAPWPAASTDTDTIKMEYDVQANDMSAGTDVAYNGIPTLTDYNQALTYYVAFILSSVEGQEARMKTYQSMYASELAMMAKLCLARPAYMPSATGAN